MEKYILSLDQGTTSSRAVLINEKAQIVSMSQKEIRQIYPKEGWVEHDPIEILNSVIEVTQEAIEKLKIQPQPKESRKRSRRASKNDHVKTNNRQKIKRGTKFCGNAYNF